MVRALRWYDYKRWLCLAAASHRGSAPTEASLRMSQQVPRPSSPVPGVSAVSRELTGNCCMYVCSHPIDLRNPSAPHFGVVRGYPKGQSAPSTSELEGFLSIEPRLSKGSLQLNLCLLRRNWRRPEALWEIFWMLIGKASMNILRAGAAVREVVQRDRDVVEEKVCNAQFSGWQARQVHSCWNGEELLSSYNDDSRYILVHFAATNPITFSPVRSECVVIRL